MELANPGDPFINGLRGEVQPKDLDTGLNAPQTSRDLLPRFLKFVPVREMALSETPEKDLKDQAVIAAVVGLRLMGLGLHDIAEVLDTKVVMLEELLQKPSTQASFEAMFMALINNNADNLQARIASHAGRALDTVVELMDDEEVRADVRLKAAQDIMDRSGANAEQFFGQKRNDLTQEDELKITYMNESGNAEKVSVTLKRK